MNNQQQLSDYFLSKPKDITTQNNDSMFQELDINQLQQHILDRRERMILDGNSGQNYENQIIAIQNIVEKANDGFNVLVYGIGSKQETLNEIFTQLMKQHKKAYFFQIMCFKPLSNVKTFLQKIYDTLHQQSTQKNPEHILNYLSQCQQKIYIIAHSIDGKKMLNEQTQSWFGQLSQCPSITLIASFDNYRYPQISRIQNTFYECIHTGIPYTDEIMQIFTESHHKNRQEEGVDYIMRSLTNKQKDIAFLFANKVIENRDGLTFDDFYELLADEMIVSSKIQLRENLKDLMDHEIIVEKGNKYTMEFSNQMLQKLATQSNLQ